MLRPLALLCGLLASAALLPDDALAAKRKRLAAAQPHAVTRVVCGVTGCQAVPAGCRAEGRYSGKGGIVYVVICPKR